MTAGRKSPPPQEPVPTPFDNVLPGLVVSNLSARVTEDRAPIHKGTPKLEISEILALLLLLVLVALVVLLSPFGFEPR